MPARVPAQAKELIVGLVDDAVRGGGSHRWACSVLGVSDDRAHRWRRRLRDTGALGDRPPGGVALHALRPAETAEILALCEQWGPVDRSHRKLAHRGSYEGRVWVSASTLRRVLAAQGLILSEPPARDPAPRVLWPDWLVWEPNKIWCWVWVPIIRSWALTRGYALHPGTACVASSTGSGGLLARLAVRRGPDRSPSSHPTPRLGRDAGPNFNKSVSGAR